MTRFVIEELDSAVFMKPEDYLKTVVSNEQSCHPQITTFLRAENSKIQQLQLFYIDVTVEFDSHSVIPGHGRMWAH